MTPRDVVKKPFQFAECGETPFCLGVLPEHEKMLTEHYGSEAWRSKVKPYILLSVTFCDPGSSLLVTHLCHPFLGTPSVPICQGSL